MNKTNIEWCDYTWNPITGCKHGCPYCYARRFAGRGLGRYKHTGFAPTFHPDRLSEPETVKKPSRIFVGSMGDLLGEWPWTVYQNQMPISTIAIMDGIADVIRNRAPWHQYIVLTKADIGNQYARQHAHILADAGAWIGCSFTGYFSLDHSPEFDRFSGLAGLDVEKKFISLEPLMYVPWHSIYIKEWAHKIIDANIKWVIIGGLTGPAINGYDPFSFRSYLNEAAAELRFSGLSVFVKNNLPYLQDLKEFPPSMNKETP